MKNPERAVKRKVFWTVCYAAEPPPILSVSEWAERNVVLPKKGNAEPGPWRADRLPYQSAMLNDPLDPASSETVWMIASQICKTLSYLIITGYHIHHDPSSILIVYPTLGNAENWSKKKFQPFRVSCPVLATLIQDDKRRTGENTILEKSFPGGDLTIAGANSPSTLREQSKRIILLDEIDGYKPNAEGDPIEQADSRARNFFNAIKIKCSTPTIKNRSRVEELYEKSDRQQWFCSCPECGHSQTLKWAQVKWTFADETGAEASKPEEAVYVCESCQAHLSDEQRIRMIQRGEWRATAPFKGIRGRHMNGLYRLIGKKKAYRSFLHEFVEEFLKVHKDREKLMVWTNLFLAETFEDQVERKDFSQLMKRVESFGPVLPEPVRVLVGAVDLQFNRIEYTITGFARDEQAWPLRYAAIHGNPHQQDVWRELARVMDTPFEHANGQKMWPNIWFVDSGGQSGREGFSKPVYQFVRARQRLGRGGAWASKGVETNNGQIRRETSVHKKTIALQLVGTDETKSLVYSRLDLEEPGPGYIHFRRHEEFGSEYFQQLTAEEVETVKVRGFAKRKWVKRRDRNEALDLFAMSIAALDKLNPDWAALERIYGKAREQKPAPETNPSKPPTGQPIGAPRAPSRRMSLPRHLPFRRR